MIAVLFARKDSVYKKMQNVDVYDIDRDATTYTGSDPVIAHPPCRAWGKYAHKAKPRPGEKELAFFALQKVRQNGGILEHPIGSRLWKEAGLLSPGHIDAYGGTTYVIDQIDFGHKAIKRTLLYMVRCQPTWFPPLSTVIPRDLERLSKPEREHTPPALAIWLTQIARRAS